MATFEQVTLALAEEATAFDDMLAGLGDEKWSSASRLPGWDVHLLVAHVASALATMLPGGSPPPPAASSGPRDPKEAARRIDQRAREVAQGQTPLSLRHLLAHTTVQALATAMRLGAQGKITNYAGEVALGNFLPSRVLECCVHDLDARAAVGVSSRPPASALAVTVECLEDKLGGSRPADLQDEIAFIEAATGRREYADPRFPVMR